MFHVTASEVSVLKTLSRLSDSGSKYIEENELLEILRSAQNDEECAQNDGNFKNALFGCAAKGFVQKSEKDGKSFYKITDDGRKQI